MKNFNFEVHHASKSDRRYEKSRLLQINTANSRVRHLTMADFPSAIEPGDVVVVNNAGTLPSSLPGFDKKNGSAIEIRLLMPLSSAREEISAWRVVLFGEGDWRTPTEKRSDPPPLQEGDRLDFSRGLSARITRVCGNISRRLVDVEFNLTGPELWGRFYAIAKPVQYSYLRQDLHLWDQQTVFSGPPLALEPPSASFALNWDLMFKLQKRGAEIIKLTHGTGLSNTGDKRIDSLLPFPELYHIDVEAQRRLLEGLGARKRLIAVGTGVVRALESWGGRLTKGDWTWTDLKIHENYKRKVVSGLLTGLHEPESSHLHMLRSFVSHELLEKAYTEASRSGYLWHEYGDMCLIT